MKKNNQPQKKEGLFSGFGKKKPIIEQPAPKKVRHIENQVKLPFLNDVDEVPGDNKYGRAEDMKDEWGLDPSEATLKRKKKRHFLALGIAAAAFILILTGVFYILPRILPGFFAGTNIELFVQPVVNLEYEDDSYRVVIESSVSLMSKPDPSSVRITEVLYNEPVVVTDEADNGYVKIMTMDGIEGYVPEKSLTDNMDCNGTLMMRVEMNTVLYADLKREGVYQVALPNGESGWIGSSGVIELGTRDEIQEVSSRYFVSSIMTFINAKYKENGLTMYGVSVNGAVYVCSEINGIDMPRTMEEQAQMGEEVTLNYDAVTGEVIIEDILPGDILFLRSPSSEPGDTTIYEMAVCTDTGTLFMISSARTTVRLKTFTAGDDICDRIITIRRIFTSE